MHVWEVDICVLLRSALAAISSCFTFDLLSVILRCANETFHLLKPSSCGWGKHNIYTVQWRLGMGDGHTENTLQTINTCNSTTIVYTHAFGGCRWWHRYPVQGKWKVFAHSLPFFLLFLSSFLVRFNDFGCFGFFSKCFFFRLKYIHLYAAYTQTISTCPKSFKDVAWKCNRYNAKQYTVDIVANAISDMCMNLRTPRKNASWPNACARRQMNG